MSWPQSCPPDLERRLQEVLSFRNHGPAELWGAVRECLVASGAEPPESIPARKAPDTRI